MPRDSIAKATPSTAAQYIDGCAVETAVQHGRHPVLEDQQRLQVEGGRQLLVEEFGERPADGGEHGEAGVLDLGRALPLQCASVGREVEGVKTAVAWHGAVQHGGLLDERQRG